MPYPVSKGSNLRSFKEEADVSQSEEFWRYLFTMHCSLYAPMRVLRLADKKIPAMDKLHFYVCQTDLNLHKYIKQAKQDASLCRDRSLLRLMDSLSRDVVEEPDGGDEEDIVDDDSYVEDDGSVAEASDSDDDGIFDSDDDDLEDDDFTNEAIGLGKGQLRQVLYSSFIHIISRYDPRSDLLTFT